ncbi:MAG TPA: NAD(P)-binding domain-containing protein [Acidimicrobiales bacterium]|nr:NAD(P)-binding domain-containing protein [Acidimicrobiales bacterium]
MDDVDLHVIGVSFRTAPLAVRERLALTPEGVTAALRAAVAAGVGEAFVLATCNRTELYVVGSSRAGAVDAWHRAVVAGTADGACPALAADARYHRSGGAAAEHLFRVACGLDSSVLGDAEVVGQLRRAVDAGTAAGTVGPRLRRLADRVLAVAKRARATTAISAGGAGVGSAAASLVAGRVAPGSSVVLVGAGDAASVIARELTKRLPCRLTVVNRSPERAAAVAGRFGAEARPWADLVPALAEADAVVTAVSGPSAVVTAEVIAAVRRLRPGWSPFVVDAGFPRNVEPVAGLDVVALDSVAEREQRLRAVRRAAVPAVERLVAEGLRAWAERELRSLSLTNAS